MGLLITPSGLRLPLFRSYGTKEYLEQKNQKRAARKQAPLPYRKQTELAGEIVSTVPVPPHAEVIVLGDTAFDAEALQQVCAKRRFSWIVSMNQERVLEGPKRKRPKVWSLAASLKSTDFATVKLTPGKGRYVDQRRVASCRMGRKAKTRTFYVHEKKLTVQSLGEVHQYRFRRFEKVERYVELCLLTFVFLECYRAEKLRCRNLSDDEKKWWRWQRTHGLCVAIRQETEEKELERLAKYTNSKTGMKKLKKILRAARPTEQRNAA